MNGLELKKGQTNMTYLSKWFGLSPNTLRGNKKSREKYLERLKFYADYHFEGKKIIIDEVHIPEYSKGMDIIKKDFFTYWGEDNDKRIDTCTRVGKKIYYNNAEIKQQVKERTVVNYTNKFKVEMYGHNRIDDGGELGGCRYVWIKDDITNEMLSKDELAIVRECADEAYGDFNEKLTFITDSFIKGEINKKEYQREYLELSDSLTVDCYWDFCSLVQKRLGFMPIKKTQLKDYEKLLLPADSPRYPKWED